MAVIPSVLLSLDVEEFDIPLEYGAHLNIEEQMRVGFEGLQAIALLLEKNNVPVTYFTTANFANRFPDSIRTLACRNEIASHCYFHSSFKEEDLLQSKVALEAICNKKVVGLRMPRMQNVPIDSIQQAGYQYDSSIHPTWIPGRYDNRHLSRTIYKENDLIRVPASVSPTLRLPLFWLAFKNYPYYLYRNLVKQTLLNDGYVCLYFHPWEFINIKQYTMPGYAKRLCGAPLLNRLQQLINDLKPIAQFKTIENYLLTRNNP